MTEISHTNEMPWDNLFKGLNEHYVTPKIVRWIYSKKLVGVIKQMPNGELIEEKVTEKNRHQFKGILERYA